MDNRPDPFGYFARKARREAAIREAAPYTLDGGREVIASYNELVERLGSVGLAVDCERRRDGCFTVYDPASGYTCGYVDSAQHDAHIGAFWQEERRFARSHGFNC